VLLLSIWSVAVPLCRPFLLCPSRWHGSLPQHGLWWLTLRVTLLSLALEAWVCVPAVKESISYLCSLILRLNFLPVSRARKSSVTHKSAITDHDLEVNHVIDWYKSKLVDREAQRQTRWIKEALWIRKTPMCMNQDPTNSATHWTRWFTARRGLGDIKTLSLGNIFSLV